MTALPDEAKDLLVNALARSGLRNTRQREHVFSILLDNRDHPTADEVYARARNTEFEMSLATVYNCLETLVGCGLVRAVNYEREPTRYCPNLSEHAHFQDRESGRVYDIDLPEEFLEQLTAVLPEGFEADAIELHFHGRRQSDNVQTARRTNQNLTQNQSNN